MGLGGYGMGGYGMGAYANPNAAAIRRPIHASPMAAAVSGAQHPTTLRPTSDRQYLGDGAYGRTARLSACRT